MGVRRIQRHITYTQKPAGARFVHMYISYITTTNRVRTHAPLEHGPAVRRPLLAVDGLQRRVVLRGGGHVCGRSGVKVFGWCAMSVSTDMPYNNSTMPINPNNKTPTHLPGMAPLSGSFPRPSCSTKPLMARTTTQKSSTLSLSLSCPCPLPLPLPLHPLGEARGSANSSCVWDLGSWFRSIGFARGRGHPNDNNHNTHKQHGISRAGKFDGRTDGRAYTSSNHRGGTRNA